uniref:Uncharacterized protein n=1 Tax=Romanomermis culicivorax TaxID=13658 RepID=A0A915JDD4_ROMCU
MKGPNQLLAKSPNQAETLAQQNDQLFRSKELQMTENINVRAFYARSLCKSAPEITIYICTVFVQASCYGTDNL